MSQPLLQTGNDFPGLRNALSYSPHTGGPITRLIETLLRCDSEEFSRGEREFAMAAACKAVTGERGFCYRLHEQCAVIQLTQERGILKEADLLDLSNLADLAGKVARGPSSQDSEAWLYTLQGEYVRDCRSEGLSDHDIHDIVLIGSTAAMLCRYETVMNAPYPDDPEFFRKLAEHFVKNGYLSDAERSHG